MDDKKKGKIVLILAAVISMVICFAIMSWLMNAIF